MTPDRIGASQETCSYRLVPSPSEEYFLSWQQAQQRVLQYINGLKIDPLQGAAIACQALQLAMADDRSIGATAPLSPVAASMTALRRILADSQPKPVSPTVEMARQCRHLPENLTIFIHFILGDPEICTANFTAESGPLWPIMPGLQRGTMKSENISVISPLKLLWTLISRGLNGRRTAKISGKGF